MRFNEDEYKKLLIYILSKCYDKPHVGKTVITTSLYFIDFNYYEIYGHSLTHESYIKSKHGIESKHFKKITEELIEKKKIYFKKQAYYNTTLHKYYLMQLPDVKFPKKKEEVIDLSIKYLITKNATTLLKYLSKDAPYKIADFNDELNYNYVYFRNSRYSIRKKLINL